ncbi:unnamed protein product [Rhodiola kirilowii]
MGPGCSIFFTSSTVSLARENMSSLVCKGKKTWPELVGENGHHAAGIIERQNHHVRAIVVPTGSPVTLDFRCDRVRVIVNKDGTVAYVPRVG